MPREVPSTPDGRNTGAETALSDEVVNAAAGPGFETLIDWIRFTLPDDASVEDAKRLLGGGRWMPTRGAYGYRSGLRREKIVIYFDGQPGMGIHVQLSGQAARQLETEGVVRSWSAFIETLLNRRATF